MKKLAIAFLTILSFTACQQQKIGFVDNGVLINEYQERVDIEANLQIKIDAFKSRTHFEKGGQISRDLKTLFHMALE